MKIGTVTVALFAIIAVGLFGRHAEAYYGAYSQTSINACNGYSQTSIRATADTGVKYLSSGKLSFGASVSQSAGNLGSSIGGSAVSPASGASVLNSSSAGGVSGTLGPFTIPSTAGVYKVNLNFSTSYSACGAGSGIYGGSATAYGTYTYYNYPDPTVTITASPTTVASGNASTLTWSSANTTSCSASGNWSGSKSTSGSQSTGALTSAQTYTITCTGQDTTSVSASVTVNIAANATVTLSASPTAVLSGATSTLTWSSANATACTASGGWSGTKSTSGSQAIPNITATTTFSIVCTGAGASASATTTVGIIQFLDIGLRANQGTDVSPDIVHIAIIPSGTSLTSPLRIAKNGTVYQVALISPTDTNATKLRIKLSNGTIQALRKYACVVPTPPTFADISPVMQAIIAQNQGSTFTSSYYNPYSMITNLYSGNQNYLNFFASTTQISYPSWPVGGSQKTFNGGASYRDVSASPSGTTTFSGILLAPGLVWKGLTLVGANLFGQIGYGSNSGYYQVAWKNNSSTSIILNEYMLGNIGGSGTGFVGPGTLSSSSWAPTSYRFVWGGNVTSGTNPQTVAPGGTVYEEVDSLGGSNGIRGLFVIPTNCY